MRRPPRRSALGVAATALAAAGLAAALAGSACSGAAETPRGPGPPAPESQDPGILLSTYLGGNSWDIVRDVTMDADGFVYATGGSSSTDFAGVASEARGEGGPRSRLERWLSEPAAEPSSDIFVVKLAPDGKLVWAHRFGGPGHDRAYAIEVDAKGFVYLAGRAGEGMPITKGALQTDFQGSTDVPPYGPQDGFVCKLQPDGASVVFCTYFGTSDDAPIRDLALGPDGDLYLASSWKSGDWPAPIARAFNNTPHGGSEAVYARLSADGRRLRWATYLGGPGWESGENSVRLDAAGRVYALFTTESPGLATPGAAQTAFGGDQDVFVARLDPKTGAVDWGTYIGGPGNESTETHELAVTREGNAVVAVPTKSPVLATTEGVVQPLYAGGGNEMWIVRLAPDGSHFEAATYLGGTAMDQPEGADVDAAGNVYISGATSSADFPVTDDAAQPDLPGDTAAVVVMLSADLSRVRYASFLGGSGKDVARSIHADPAGRRVVLGSQTTSDDWPVKNAFQREYRGGPIDSNLTVIDVARVAAPPPAQETPPAPEPSPAP